MTHQRGLRLAAAGGSLSLQGKTVRIASFERTPDDLLEVVVDHGDRLERLMWSDFAAEVMIPARTVVGDRDRPVQSPRFEELDDEAQRSVRARFQDLQQVISGSRSGDPEVDRRRRVLDPAYDPERTTKSQRLRTKLRELRARQDAPFSRAQVYRQLKAVETSGIDGLIHGGTKTVGERLARLDPEDLDAMREILSEVHVEGKPPDKVLYSKVRSGLDQRGRGAQLSHYALKLAVGELTRGTGGHLVAKQRGSRDINPVRPHRSRIESAPGDLVQIDATATNVPVFDPIAGWVPATILTAIDVCTRMVVALSVFVGPATGRHVRGLIFRMTQPSVLRSGYPYELTNWTGIPRLVNIHAAPDSDAWLIREAIGAKPAVWPTTIAVDRGGENNNLSVIEACSRVGIDIIFVPPGAGFAKGLVESFQAEWDRLASVFTSYKGANPLNHAKGVEDRAVLTAGDLEDILWTHSLSTYHHRPHAGLRRDLDTGEPLTPASAWAGHMAAGGEVYVPIDPMRYISLLDTDRRKVGDDGIHLHGMVYNSADVTELRQYAQRGVGTKSQTVTVYSDEFDVSRIFVRHPVTGSTLCVPKVIKGGAGVESPYGQVVRRHILDLARVDGERLDASAIVQRMADLRSRWDHGVYLDRRDQRRAALVHDQQRLLAQELADAGEDIRRLMALPEMRPSTEKTYPSLDADDEELFAYDEYEPEDLAL